MIGSDSLRHTRRLSLQQAEKQCDYPGFHARQNCISMNSTNRRERAFGRRRRSESKHDLAADDDVATPLRSRSLVGLKASS